MFVVKFIIASILVEAITEIVVKSDIFYPLRKYLFSKKDIKLFDFLHNLLDCGYCFSVWVGWFISILLTPLMDFVIINEYIDWFFIGIIIHRVSNVVHFIIDMFKKWASYGKGG